MDEKLTEQAEEMGQGKSPRSKGRPYVYGMVMFAALAMFVAIGGSVGTQMVRQIIGTSKGADQAMVSALMLNIALILLIWRRTTVLSDEVDVYRQAEVRAQHMAMTDPLTNLFNRRAIKEKTTELSARAARRGACLQICFTAISDVAVAIEKTVDAFGGAGAGLA